MSFNNESYSIVKKTFLAFFTLLAFYSMGLVEGGTIGFFHEQLTIHMYLFIALITCATFSLTFIFLIPKKQRDKILKPILVFSFTIIFILFAKNINKIIPRTNHALNSIKIVIQNIEESDINYLDEIDNISSELKNSTLIFELISNHPNLISKKLIISQIENTEQTIRKLQILSPPKKYERKILLLYSIALTRYDNLVKYKNKEYFETILYNKRIRDNYSEKCCYLHYGDCGRIKSI